MTELKAQKLTTEKQITHKVVRIQYHATARDTGRVAAEVAGTGLRLTVAGFNQ
jgi:hypothetical protein